jgi:3',5'-cyclic AMP phosphodiesterase CpdA
MALVLAHISDFHVSRFGEHVTSLKSRRLLGRSARRGAGWEPAGELGGWRVERREKALRLVDQDGVVHAARRARGNAGDGHLAELLQLARERQRTEHSQLAASIPKGPELSDLLQEDPTNTNLLFCRAAERLLEDGPDWVLITGDLTDNGIGYDLILAALAPWIERRRVLAVPGNHDLYETPPLVVPGHARKGEPEKRALWASFATRLGLPGGGAWVHELGEGVTVCGIDSCIPAHAPFSASGAVTDEALGFIGSVLKSASGGTLRVGMLHHHVVNLPFKPTGWAPWQLGIRLRNARPVYEFFVEHAFSLVLNGHRHVGYRYHPNHAPLFVSAPSATLGCRSGAAPRPFYWRVEINDREVTSVRERLI